MKNLAQQFARFGVVGTIAFVIDYATMVFLTEVFGVDYLVSTTVGFIVSVIFNYIASMRFVFRHKEDMSRQREFVVFMVLSVIGLGLNDLLMWLGTGLVGIDYRIMKVLATMMVTIYNFITRKMFLDADPVEIDQAALELLSGSSRTQVQDAHGGAKADAGAHAEDALDGSGREVGLGGAAGAGEGGAHGL